MSEPTTAAEQQAAIQTEYGTYVAAKVITIAGARAFNPGDPVPVSHVKNKIVTEDQVTKAKAPAAAESKG